MKRTLSVLALCATLVPAAAVEDTDGSLGKLPAPDRATMLDVLDLNLNDGPSTRLRNVHVPREGIVCGLLNTKNRMGAFMGYRRFFMDLRQRDMHVTGEDMPPGKASLYSALMDTNCRFGSL